MLLETVFGVSPVFLEISSIVALGEGLIPLIAELHLRLREGLTRGNRPNAQSCDAGASHLQQVAASSADRIPVSECFSSFILGVH